ncbi:hypothetical protein [Flavobacterium sp. GCM10027622]|uniref:hypothetical protein n=1 Tax=unclassified Flavobacterium TaxID=196869 RepID=UPI00361F4CAA
MKILNVLLFLIAINGFSQSIQGKFNWCEPSNTICSEYSFKDNKFEILTIGDVGIQLKDKGYYFVSKDTLILAYDNPIDKRLEVVNKEKVVDVLGNTIKNTKLEIEILNSDKTVAVKSSVVLFDKDGKVIKGFMVNDQGKLDLILSDVPEIAKISFANLNDEVVVDFSDFLYYKSKVKVILSTNKSRYRDRKGIHKYLIKKGKSKDELRLFDIQNDVLFIFKKV